MPAVRLLHECPCSAHPVDAAVAAGGNARLVQALAEDVPVLYNTPVASVDYGGGGVTVTTVEGSAVVADACIVTVPLGVLKADTIDFQPPLPEAKRQAISRLGCAGVLSACRLQHSVCVKVCVRESKTGAVCTRRVPPD